MLRRKIIALIDKLDVRLKEKPRLLLLLQRNSVAYTES